jgi:fumarate hydratase subunit alpha
MREVMTKKLTEVVKNLCLEANTSLSEDVQEALNKALAKEESPTGREILREILQNAKFAWRDKMPLCQDTGLVTVFLEVGQQVCLSGSIAEAVNEGVSRAYHEGNLRKSITADPLNRKNTNDNTPAIIHLECAPGENIRVRLLAKGGGAENCSAIRMFTPSSTQAEINAFIIETIEKGGPNACPPVIVGIGLGGSFDSAPILAKKALLRPIGQRHSGKDTADWEKELLELINKTGIGPMGLGGRTTALAVQIERAPCHISCLPVAVNLDCHSHRYKEAVI